MSLLRAGVVAVLFTGVLGGCAKTDEDEDAAGFVPPVSVARSDFEASLPARFARLDRNGDGLITATEVPAARSGMIARYDLDGDGKLTRDEFVKGVLARFDREDSNHDGTVTNEERSAARVAMDAENTSIGNAQ